MGIQVLGLFIIGFLLMLAIRPFCERIANVTEMITFLVNIVVLGIVLYTTIKGAHRHACRHVYRHMHPRPCYRE